MVVNSVGGMWKCRVTARRRVPWARFVLSMFAVSCPEQSWSTVLADIWVLIAGLSEYSVYLRSSFSVTKNLHRENLNDNQPPPISWVVSLGCVPTEAAQVAVQAFKQKQSRPFVSCQYFFFSTKPERVLSALLWICTSLSVWRDLKEIWKVCQHYEWLYYN